MGKVQSNTWMSDYTLESKEKSNGKLKEVFRGANELDNYIGRVGSVVVHYLPPHAAFDTTLRSKRIFYAWEKQAEIIINSEAADLKEDHKVFVGSIYPPVTVGNKNAQHPSLVIEVSYFPFSKDSYKTVGEGVVEHIPIVSNPQEIKEFLDGKLEQITVHNLLPYSLEGNHYHNNGKKELFLVADGLVHTFERKIKKSSESFDFDEILKKIQSGEIDYESYVKGGSFSFGDNGFSHAIAAGKKPAKLIELANTAFDPSLTKYTIKPDIIVPKSVNERKSLLDKLSQSL
jgi:hypothetical protein